MRLRIEHAGTPVSARLVSFSCTKAFNGRISQASYQLQNAADPILQTECKIINDEDESIVFRGIIVKHQRENSAPSRYWTSVDCVGIEYLLPRAIISHTWTATKPRVILQDAFGEKLPIISTDDSTVEDLGSAIDFEAKDMPLDRLVVQLAEITGAEWRISEDMELLFRAAKSHAAAFEIDQANPDGSTKFRCKGLRSGSDSVEFANRVTVLGFYEEDGTELRGEDEDAPSIDEIGLREIAIPMRNLTTQAAVDEAAEIILASRMEYLKTIELKLDHGRLNIDYAPITEVPQPGDVLTISAPNQAALSGEFQIQQIRLRQVTPPNPENSDKAWTEVQVEAGDFPGSIVERLRNLTTKAKDGTDGKTTGTTLPPYTPPGGEGEGDCECDAVDCCHLRLRKDCDGISLVSDALPVAYSKIDSGDKTIYRHFYHDGAWTAKELVWDPSSSSANYMSLGNIGPSAACYGAGMMAAGPGGSDLYFVEFGQTPIDITPWSAISSWDSFGGNGFSQSRVGPWLRKNSETTGHWYAVINVLISSVWYVAVIKSAEVTEAGEWRPAAGEWTIMGTGPNDGTGNTMANARLDYDGEDTITVWGGHTGSTTHQFWDFSMATDTWGSPYGSVAITGAFTATGGCNGLFKLANGTRVILYEKGSPADVYYLVYTESGGTYGSEIQFDGNEETSAGFNGGILHNEIVHAVYAASGVGVGTRFFYRPIIAGVAGTAIELYQGGVGQNPFYGGMIVWRNSLIITITKPNGGSFGQHFAYHGKGGLPPSSFEGKLIDDSNEAPFGGLLGFALDPDASDADPEVAAAAGEILAQLGPDGAIADKYRFGTSGDYALRADSDGRKFVAGEATLVAGAVAVSTGLSIIRSAGAILKGTPTGETLGVDYAATGGTLDLESDDGASTGVVCWSAFGDP